MRRVAGILIGLIAGVITIGVVEGISSLIHPMPEGLDWNDKKARGEWVMSLPFSAYLMILLAHAGGAFVAAMVCQLIVRDRWVAAWVGLGVFLLLGGLVNFVSIPHPMWVAVSDLLLYVPSAVLGGTAATKLRNPPAQS